MHYYLNLILASAVDARYNYCNGEAQSAKSYGLWWNNQGLLLSCVLYKCYNSATFILSLQMVHLGLIFFQFCSYRFLGEFSLLNYYYFFVLPTFYPYNIQ